jgi:hypothetical protein
VVSVTRLRTETLAGESRVLLARLGSLAWFADFYLAGSAGLTLHLGHRPVRDLDLMSPVQRLRSIERRDHLQDLLELDANLRVETARDGYLYVRSAADIALRFFHYPYPLVETGSDLEGAAIASLVDLGLMKLGAVISRGTRRDFVDLYLLCHRVPLDHLLARSHEKFGHVRDFPLQALKGLADRSQIDDEPMPELSIPATWREIEDWLDKQVRTLGRQEVGLD